MAYAKAKVYSDGSHYIAVSETKEDVILLREISIFRRKSIQRLRTITLKI
ncbi:MAG: hypothetical protein ACI4SH_09490 [Candidatus Scatosoma sp.]